MAGKKKKVFIAISGGVDSSTAAALLLKDGYDCAGIFMITCDHGQQAKADAERIAEKLNIKLHVLDLREDFEKILDYFCSEYKKARTPNPCAFCNRHVKFGKLFKFAQDKGADLLATGHYARIAKSDKGTGLYQAADTAKDQSYALAMINRDILEHIILPMGDYSKKRTREMAATFGLGIEKKQESQEICFIPNDDYAAVLELRCPQLVRRGNIVDSSGTILGEHNGIHRFTIGQRRGLRVAMGRPYYVVKLDAETNTVTLGPKEELMHKTLTVANLNWLADEPVSDFRAKVKIRYNSPGVSALVLPKTDTAIVEFDEPVSAITPGQLAVFYIQDQFGSRVTGGGWIDKVGN